MIHRKKCGLALGGGAARGIAHIGVLKVLQKEGVQIDMIAGTSAGAIVGALYAQGKDADVIANLTLNLTRKRMFSFFDLTLPKKSLVQEKRIESLLHALFGGDTEFNELKIPFACIATDIITGQEVIINRGSLIQGVRASISIPVIFEPVQWEGRFLVDGGLVNPVPVSTLKKMGADFIIAVNVVPSFNSRVQKTQTPEAPNILDTLLHSIYIGTSQLAKQCLAEADIIIEPQVQTIGASNFQKAKECILLGEKAAQESLVKIRTQLGFSGHL